MVKVDVRFPFCQQTSRVKKQALLQSLSSEYAKLTISLLRSMVRKLDERFNESIRICLVAESVKRSLSYLNLTI